MNTLQKIAFILVIVGGLNWGLMGFFNFNLVTAIFGEMTSMTSITSIVYDLVGLSAIYSLVSGWKMM